MKITAVKTHVLQASLGEHGFGWSQRVTDRRQSAICVVDTDEGIRGVGEAFYFGGPAQVAMIDRIGTPNPGRADLAPPAPVKSEPGPGAAPKP